MNFHLKIVKKKGCHWFCYMSLLFCIYLFTFFALRVLCGQGITALEYFGPELSFKTCVMLFCGIRAKIFVTPILLFGDLIGKIEKSYKLLAIYLYSVTGNIIQVGLLGSFPVVYCVVWLIVFEFLNSFHL